MRVNIGINRYLKQRFPKLYCKWGGVSINLNIKSSMSRMMMIRCAFESWDLSASNDVPTSIFGPILTYLGWPEGQKSAKIVEISASPTPLEKAKFSLFRKKRALACEICTWEYQVVVKICCSDSKEGNWIDKNAALGFRRWNRRFGGNPGKIDIQSFGG